MSDARFPIRLRANVVPIRLGLASAMAALQTPPAIRVKAWQVWTLVTGAAGTVAVLLYLVRAVAS